MMENFVEYMWYLLTTPFKRVKKSINKWYALCKVFGKRFDEAKEDILRARDEGMVATCCDEMLPVHGADRRLTRYEGEHPENFRSRIAMYEEICKLGGTNEGILLAVRTLGYTSPKLIRANELTGYVHFNLDGSWLLDGSRMLDSDTIENRWAEFYLVIVMDAGDEHPISFDILRKTVRIWKEVGAKDNYFMKYLLSINEIHNIELTRIAYRKFLYFFDYLKTDGKWQLDGSRLMDATWNNYPTWIGYRYEGGYELPIRGLVDFLCRQKCQVIENVILKVLYQLYIDYFDYLKTDGSWQTDGEHHLDAQRSPRVMKWGATFRHNHHQEFILKQWYRMQPCSTEQSVGMALERYKLYIDYFDYLKLNGLWKLTGSRQLGAGRMDYNTKQEYRFGVSNIGSYRVMWHEEHNLFFLDGTWNLDGSKIIDAWQKTEVL